MDFSMLIFNKNAEKIGVFTWKAAKQKPFQSIEICWTEIIANHCRFFCDSQEVAAAAFAFLKCALRPRFTPPFFRSMKLSHGPFNLTNALNKSRKAR